MPKIQVIKRNRIGPLTRNANGCTAEKMSFVTLPYNALMVQEGLTQLEEAINELQLARSIRENLPEL